MGQIVVCDLCGKKLTGGMEQRNFKVKELKSSWDALRWQRIDVHRECLEKLLEAVNSEGEPE